MKSAPRAGLWMGAAFIGALTLAIAAIIARGPGLSGVGIGLRLTARFSYTFFWLAYVGGSFTNLFGPRFRIIGRRGRELGLAFASAQLVHVGLVAWLAWLSQPQSMSDAVMPYFAIAIVWTCLLAALSSNARQVFNPQVASILMAIGSEYIALAFFTDFVLLPKYPMQISLALIYIPFWIMIFVGPLLRIASAAKKILTRWRYLEARSSLQTSS